MTNPTDRDNQEKSKVVDESDSTIPDPSHQTVTSTPPNNHPHISTEITPFIALQLRVARLEQEMSEEKKTDHFVDVLASIKSQVPTVVDKYLGTKLDDSLLRILERHTADLIEKYSVLPGPESIKNQEYEKDYARRLKEIIRISKNRVKKPQIESMKWMMMKDDDDDEEGPLVGSNQGNCQQKEKTTIQVLLGQSSSYKVDEQSSQKPRVSDASASQHIQLYLNWMADS
ncbi:hypothetical protein Tco_0955884 [Tanacetum coccineum]|uniref:Uncharacterized protein n=1 Tax=Tanacetum coccineum TaxID=301880 RepID=A0ABQ5E8I9_9ASTR